MGFFSSIKRLWSGSSEKQEKPEVPAKESAQETPSGEQADTAEEPRREESPSEPVELVEPAESADLAEPAESVAAKKEPEEHASLPSEAADSRAPAEEEEQILLLETPLDPESAAEPVAGEPETPKPAVTDEPESAPAAPAPEEPEMILEEPEVVLAEPVHAPAQEAVQPVPAEPAGWRESLLLALREAEPRLSVWLSIALEDLGPDARTGNELWDRVRFLLTSLGAPQDEAEAFVSDFAAWADRMEYEEVADFRSELQYRLALALDLEDEEDERNRIFLKLHQGLERTREQLGKGLSTLFASHGDLSADFWDELEELFIMADMGVEAATELCKRLKARARNASATTPEELRPLLAAELEDIFRIPRRVVAVNAPEVVLIIGVNGVGKTTTIAKLAYRAKMQGKKVLLAAADTFRAAAVNQLGIWAERTGSGFHSKGQDADPAAVAWEAMDIAIRDGYDVVFVDTAGRLHTKSNLMDELHKIREVIARKHPGAPHRSILIVDATTGQNALQQTKIFKEAAGIDELILTKLDGTAKGGVAVAVSMQYGIPITYVGLGEKMEDLRPFNGDDFARALLDQ